MFGMWEVLVRDFRKTLGMSCHLLHSARNAKLFIHFRNFAAMSGSQLPMIFQTADLVFEDRVSAYKNDILGLCKPREVPERIAKYIAQNVDASGWQAVWRSTPKSSGQQPFDVVVEVNDLIFSSLNRLKESYNQVLSIYYLS